MRLEHDNACTPLAAVRSRARAEKVLPADIRYVVKNMENDTDWSQALDNVDVVIHAAAHAHAESRPGDTSDSALDEVNLEATMELARQAMVAGVKRFVFISTVGVHGTESGACGFSENSPAKPASDYARSKWRAEENLGKLLAAQDMQLVIVRAPMVYGPGAPGKFRRLCGLVERGIPLPFASIKNQRSFIAIDNLVDLIVACVKHPAAANQVFTASDNEDLSTPELIRRIAAAMGKTPKLFPFPEFLLKLLLSIMGKKDLGPSLLGSFQVDSSKAREMLNWEPRVSVDAALEQVVRHWPKSAQERDSD